MLFLDFSLFRNGTMDEKKLQKLREPAKRDSAQLQRAIVFDPKKYSPKQQHLVHPNENAKNALGATSGRTHILIR